MSDPFAAVAGLVALITDVKACAKRLDELRATIDAAEKARAQLEAARIANERAFAETKADLDRRQTRLSEGEGELRLRVSAFNGREARGEWPTSIEDRFPSDPNLGVGTQWRGLVRDIHHE
jgi:septal ring factor EnvC (AmiA/AmiB activator)